MRRPVHCHGRRHLQCLTPGRHPICRQQPRRSATALPEALECLRRVRHDPITTCVVNWQTDRTSEAAVASVKERWPTSLKVFREAMVSALDTSGIRAWPHGAEGHEVRAAPLGKIRDEFKAIYPADGDTPRQREDAKRSGFKRAMDAARTKRLVGSRDLNGVDHLWFEVSGEEP